MDEPPEYSNTSLFLEAVTRIAGEAGVAAIKAARDGTQVLIPITVKPKHWFAVALGYETAAALCGELKMFDADNKTVGNFQVHIPQGDLNRFNITQTERRDDIRRSLMAGEDINSIALRLRTNVRTVKRHRASLLAFGKLKRRSRLPGKT